MPAVYSLSSASPKSIKIIFFFFCLIFWFRNHRAVAKGWGERRASRAAAPPPPPPPLTCPQTCWARHIKLESVILITVTGNCLPFSYSRSIFRRHLSWKVLKIAFRSLQIWEFSGGEYPRPPYKRLVPSALAITAPVRKNLATALNQDLIWRIISKILTSTIYRLWTLHCFLYQTSLGPNRPRLMHVSDLNTA